MKFSLVNGERREAEKGLSGGCIGCGQPVIPKCGQIKVWHWAHKSKCQCDHWWENETEWHRRWKNQFPANCQEVRQKSEGGEWHIADVKTSQGWVLEFQNSAISFEEREARNAFYRNIAWVVNGGRLKRDKDQFINAIERGATICQNPQVIKVSGAESSIVERWSKCTAPVFFDFGDDPLLWCLYPGSSDQWCFVAPIRREVFIACHQEGEDQLQKFIGFLQVFSKVLSIYAAQIEKRRQAILHRQVFFRPQTRFERHLARQRSRRRL